MMGQLKSTEAEVRFRGDQPTHNIGGSTTLADNVTALVPGCAGALRTVQQKQPGITYLYKC